MRSNKEISDILKGNILMDYMITIRGKVLVKKKRAIMEYFNRADHQMIMASEYKDNGMLTKMLNKEFNGSKEKVGSDSNNDDTEEAYMEY